MKKHFIFTIIALLLIILIFCIYYSYWDYSNPFDNVKFIKDKPGATGEYILLTLLF